MFLIESEYNMAGWKQNLFNLSCREISLPKQTIISQLNHFITKVLLQIQQTLISFRLILNSFLQVCRLTGGQLYKYTYFQPDIDAERFLSDLRHNLSRPVVFDAIMRVRTSTGVRPVEFFGNFYMANTTDIELASLNSDMAVACKSLK